MNLILFLISSTFFTGVFSWGVEDMPIENFGQMKEEETGKNMFTGWFDSLQDYFEYQENKLSDSFDNFIDGIQEKKNQIEQKLESYMETIKETGRKATESFGVFEANNETVNPDLLLTAHEIIERNGYICETHTVVSQGYELNIHRIPTTRNETSGKTILLQHGLLSSSIDWILNGPGKALAYVLADAGYDVWMSNIRGNRYSRKHRYYNTESEEYWDFSWHDVAMYDVPKIVDYILDFKGSGTKIVYMGHSMGTTILFAMLTMRPKYNHILTAGYALAPEVYFTNLKSPIKSLASITSNVAYIESLYGSNEFVPKNSVLGSLTSACSTDILDTYLCSNIVFYICGDNEKQFNKTLLPMFLSHLGTGTSWKTIVHFSQLINSGKFQQFDYGSTGNLFHYGSIHPPEYDLSQITLPISLFWSQNDLLSSEEDVMLLKSKLKTKTRLYMVPDPKFNHLDYIWAIDVNVLLNDNILEDLNTDFGQ